MGESLVGGGERGGGRLVRPLRHAYEQAVDDEELAGARGHGRRAQLTLAGRGGGQDVVGVLRDGPVRPARDRDGRGPTLEGDPEWLDDVPGRPGVRDRDRDVLRAQLHGVGDGEVRVAVGVRHQPYAQQLLGEILGDQAGGADAVYVDAAGGGERADGG